MVAAMLCCAAFVTLGIAVSYPLNLPSGPVIILIAGAAYLLAASAAALRRR
jgi:zinc transport system permease protein